MFIRFADVSRPGGRAAMSYVVAVPEMLAATAPTTGGGTGGAGSP